MGNAAHSRYGNILNARSVNTASKVAQWGGNTRVAHKADLEWEAARIGGVGEMETRLRVRWLDQSMITAPKIGQASIVECIRESLRAIYGAGGRKIAEGAVWANRPAVLLQASGKIESSAVGD